MGESHLSTLLCLRVLVGFLGEQSRFAWWATAFFGDYSRRSLEFIVPKTAHAAQYHGVVEAARRLHDEHLSVGSFHLFRLPEEVEQDLHAMLDTDEGRHILQTVVGSGDDALALLADPPFDKGGISQPVEGPTAVGHIAQLASADISKTIAVIYHSAFANRARAYPYLVG